MADPYADRLPRWLIVPVIALALSLCSTGVAAASTDSGGLTQLTGDAGCIKGTAGYSWIPCLGTVRGLYDVSSIVLSPDGRFAYAVSLYSGYRTDSSGKVSYIPGGTIVTFMRDPTTGALAQLPGAAGCIKDSAATATQVTLPCTSTARGIRAAKEITLSPDGRFAYVASLEAEAIAVFARDPSSGALTQLGGGAGCVRDVTAVSTDCSVTAVGLHGARWLTVSPDGRNLYASSPAADAIAAFSRDLETGVITQLPGADACIEDRLARLDSCSSQGVGLNYPRSLTVSPDGRNVYVASDHADSAWAGDAGDGDAISIFSRDAATGALHQLGGNDACIEDVHAPASTTCPTAAKGLFGVFEVVVSADGRFAYTASAYGGTVAAFSRNSVTGALTPLPDPAACFGAYNCTPAYGIRGANAITLSPDQRFVYVAGFDARAVAVFSRDPVTGRLAQLGGTGSCVRDISAGDQAAPCPVTIKGLNGPRKLTISPDGKNAYVPSSSGSTIAVFAVVAGTPDDGGTTPPPPGSDSSVSTPPPDGHSSVSIPPPPDGHSSVSTPPPPGGQSSGSAGPQSGGAATAPPPRRPRVHPAAHARLTRSGRLSLRLVNRGDTDADVTLRLTVSRGVALAARGEASCGQTQVSTLSHRAKTAHLRLTAACTRLLDRRGAVLRVEIIAAGAAGEVRRTDIVQVRR